MATTTHAHQEASERLAALGLPQLAVERVRRYLDQAERGQIEPTQARAVCCCVPITPR